MHVSTEHVRMKVDLEARLRATECLCWRGHCLHFPCGCYCSVLCSGVSSHSGEGGPPGGGWDRGGREGADFQEVGGAVVGGEGHARREGWCMLSAEMVWESETGKAMTGT